MRHVDDNGSVADFANEFADEPIELGVAATIHLPPEVGNVVFYVIIPMLQLVQMKGLFGG